MAEGLLNSFDPRIDAHSAGTQPAGEVNPNAIRVMREIGLDISNGRPKTVDGFLGQSIDYVITVCGDAEENCPVFQGKVGRRIHMGFPDPANATGTQEEILSVFRQSRDDIKARFFEFYLSKLKAKLDAPRC
jgi:arsenate reductase